jgi:hypothetical protein
MKRLFQIIKINILGTELDLWGNVGSKRSGLKKKIPTPLYERKGVGLKTYYEKTYLKGNASFSGMIVPIKMWFAPITQRSLSLRERSFQI